MTKQPFQVGDLVATNFPGQDGVVWRVVECALDDHYESGWKFGVIDTAGECPHCVEHSGGVVFFDPVWLSLVGPAPAAATTASEPQAVDEAILAASMFALRAFVNRLDARILALESRAAAQPPGAPK
jgi:hypothetical protein